MHFSLESKPFGTVERYVIHADDSELEILAGFGAGLNAWRVVRNGCPLDLLYGYRDAETFRKIHADTNAGACLSPFPGRTANAEWKWNGKSYKLANNVSWAPHALHGFLQTLPWRMESFSSDEKAASLSLVRDFYGNSGFPFTYRVTNVYSFFGNGFSVKSIVENTGTGTLPYAEGFHPYFTLGKKVDGLVLKLPACSRALLDSADIPTGRFEKETRFDGETILGETFVNDYFSFETESAERETVSLADPSNGNRIDVWQRTGRGLWRGVQIYTPPDRKSVAMEPMTSAPDVLNHHRELIEIAPGKSAELLFGADFVSGNA